MPALASDLRRQLENTCVQARDLAEAAARSALQKRAVDTAEPFTHFTAADKELRTRLRARGRQAGDVRDDNKKTQGIDQLTQELAYEYWHRMLFARFLAENHLLMHPDGVAVSLEECDELAKSEGAPNGFVLAARYASRCRRFFVPMTCCWRWSLHRNSGWLWKSCWPACRDRRS